MREAEIESITSRVAIKSLRMLAASMCILMILPTGCSDRTLPIKPGEGSLLPPPNPPEVVIKEELPQEISAGKDKWLDTNKLPIEVWYSQYLNGKCIGYSQVTIAPSETQGANRLRLIKRDVLEAQVTASQPIQRQETVIESSELPDGQFIKYEESSNAGGVDTQIKANLQGKTLVISNTVDGNPTTASLPWIEGAWGPLGTIAILRQMQPDQQRTAQVLVPQLGKFVKVELKSGKRELTVLPDGVVSELLLVETLMVADGKSSLTKNWISKTGEIVKSISQSGLTMFQTTREAAADIDDEIQVAQLIATKVPVSAKVSQFQTSPLTYLIDATNLDPFSILSDKVNQRVKSISALGAEVTVFRTTATESAKPGEIAEGLIQDAPDPAYSLAIDADTPQMKKFLGELPAAPTPGESVSQLTEAVFRQLKKEPLSRKFVSPAKAIQAGSGDCKAHAMLLVAALRQRGIPARAASGLRIGKADGEIYATYHMWCEAWLDDHWLPLDPHLGTVGVNVDHLKFLDSSLNDLNPNSDVRKVLQAMQQLTIAVKSP